MLMAGPPAMSDVAFALNVEAALYCGVWASLVVTVVVAAWLILCRCCD